MTVIGIDPGAGAIKLMAPAGWRPGAGNPGRRRGPYPGPHGRPGPTQAAPAHPHRQRQLLRRRRRTRMGSAAERSLSRLFHRLAGAARHAGCRLHRLCPDVRIARRPAGRLPGPATGGTQRGGRRGGRGGAALAGGHAGLAGRRPGRASRSEACQDYLAGGRRCFCTIQFWTTPEPSFPRGRPTSTRKSA